MDNAIQDRHESGTEAIQRTAPSPHSTRSFSPPSLSSLPTEILTSILEEIPRHPSKDRSASLSRICLVNKFFLSIARPLLYRNLHLNLREDYDDASTRYHQLTRTLTAGGSVSQLVKHLRVSFEEERSTTFDMAVLAHVLSRLGPLESIRTSFYFHCFQEDLAAAFVLAIVVCQKGLKRLEIPKLHGQDWQSFLLVVTRLPALEVFVGDLESTVEPMTIKPICHLRRLVVTTLFQPDSFEYATQNSHATLTSLSIWIHTSSDLINLSSFPHLALLRISISQSPTTKSRPIPGPDPEKQDLDDFLSITLRQLLLSIRDLPIKTLGLSHQTSYGRLGDALRCHPLLDVLPPSIVHLAAISPVFSHHEQLIERIRNSSYPQLKRLSILPLSYRGREHDELVAHQQEEAKLAVEGICSEYGVEIEIVEREVGPVDPRQNCDPYQTDSETEDEDGETEIDEGDLNLDSDSE